MSIMETMKKLPYGEEGQVLAVISGPADVTCSVCGRTREWFASEESLRELIEQIKKLREKERWKI